MVSKDKKKPVKRTLGIKDLKPRKLTSKQARDVRGGAKHIAGVKYEET